MSRLLLVSTTSLVLLLGCQRKGDGGERYPVTFRDRQTGDRFEVTESYWIEAYREINGEGKEVTPPGYPRGDRYVYREDYLDVQTPKASVQKLRRVYSTAEKRWRWRLPQPDENFHNAEVTLVKDGTRYRIESEAGRFVKPSWGDFVWLQRRMQDFAPPHPVRVGESWDLDKAVAAQQFCGESSIDSDQCSATGTLNRVYDKDGRRFGIVELKLVVVPEWHLRDVPAIRFRRTITIDGCIDGTSSEMSVSNEIINDRVAPHPNPKPGLDTMLLIYEEAVSEIARRPAK